MFKCILFRETLFVNKWFLSCIHKSDLLITRFFTIILIFSVSTQLCDEVALQLTKAANNVVELYRRLTDADATTSSEQLASVQKTDMVKNLEMSIIRTQKMLQDLTFERLKQSNGGVDINQTDTVKKLNDLVAKGQASDPKKLIIMMQQYSDILLGMMQQKIQNSSN